MASSPHEEPPVLQKDKANSTYELLLKRAVEEGRVGPGGSHCRQCGMRYNDAAEAERCCEKVVEHKVRRGDAFPSLESPKAGKPRGRSARRTNGFADSNGAEPPAEVHKYRVAPTLKHALLTETDDTKQFVVECGTGGQTYGELLYELLTAADGDPATAFGTAQYRGSTMTAALWQSWIEGLVACEFLTPVEEHDGEEQE
jgi:hypothetical protein